MGEARRRGTRADRMAAPKGGEWRRTRRIDCGMDLAIVGDETTGLVVIDEDPRATAAAVRLFLAQRADATHVVRVVPR